MATLLDGMLESSEVLQHRLPGEPLFLEGETPAGVYILHTGEVALQITARNGTVKPLRVATAGQVLGLSEVVGQRPASCSAVARVPCDTGFIARDVLMDALKERPAIWFNVLRLLSSDVNSAYQEIRGMAG